MRKSILAAAVFAAIAGGAGVAAAQTYPSRPVMMIVPLATGGSTDTIGRIMAEGMPSMRSAFHLTTHQRGLSGTGNRLTAYEAAMADDVPLQRAFNASNRSGQLGYWLSGSIG